VLTIQTFANTVAYVDLTGAELQHYLPAAVNKEAGSGAFAQFAGANIIMQGDQLVAAQIDGKAIVADKIYRLAINTYIASGGDGYPKLNNYTNLVNSGFVAVKVLKDSIMLLQVM
jgi:5'-nucleotidase/UDP-sugar diphosphatase